MKNYIKPEFKVNVFSVEDVITVDASMPFYKTDTAGATTKDYVKSVDYTTIFK